MSKLNVGVIFGSRSVEHDVSIVTAQQVIRALNPAKYQVVPIYIDRGGRWFTGQALTTLKNFEIEDVAQISGVQPTHLSPNVAYPGLITPPTAGFLGKNRVQPLDILFPVVHGSHGEDGTLQGLFELLNLPYVGTGVLASAIANDKGMTKKVLQAHGLPVIEKYAILTRREWEGQRQSLLENVIAEIGYPLFVKPLTLGSSIGVAKAADPEAAAHHIDIALALDVRVLVEQAAVKGKVVEINCAVLGNAEIRASTLEQPISYEEFLTYEEKYMRKGSDQGMKAQERIIPAPLEADLTQKIKEAAINAFKAIRGRGTARLDFLLATETGDFWINEINTLPGSLAFYLWEPEGLSAGAVCDELIRLAREAHAEKQGTTYNYRTKLIGLAAARGAKGSKGGAKF